MQALGILGPAFFCRCGAHHYIALHMFRYYVIHSSMLYIVLCVVQYWALHSIWRDIVSCATC